MKDNLNKLLQVRNLANGEAALYFYGEIVSSWWGAWDAADQYPEKIRNFLAGVSDKNLNLHINSGGGSVVAAMAIVNMLRGHSGKKTCYIDGLAASSASANALCCDRVIMPRNTFLMIHRTTMSASGNANEMKQCAEILEKAEECMLSVYEGALASGVSIETVKDLMYKETWFTAEEAARYFRVEIAEAIAEPAAMAAKELPKSAPEAIKKIAALALERERLKLLNLKKEG